VFGNRVTAGFALMVALAGASVLLGADGGHAEKEERARAATKTSLDSHIEKSAKQLIEEGGTFSALTPSAMRRSGGIPSSCIKPFREPRLEG
jgi:hypothetical protein